ncbi:MAG: cation-translocating P-type ATPase [Rhodospirillales bacterium]|nr:cation-translocating P-type ATPase [Rhodospirillales bacterium]MDP6774326.1 cation-translocating P-type ATPase [Rhodospirillales bacterium]
MDCKLCGLPAPAPPIEADGHPFCCFGCREVYRNFGPDILASDSVPSSVQQDILTPHGKEAFLRIDGMHCSSCEILIERMAEMVDGILSAKSSFATSTAKIVYDPDVIDEADLPEALKSTGYQARLSTEEAPEYDDRLDLLRVLTGAALAGLVMMLYIAFFYPVNLGLIDANDLEPVQWLAYGIAPKAMFLVTTVLIIYVGAPIFRGAWIGWRARVPNMDNLLAIAILAAYGYSFGQLVSGSLDLYFDVAATIITVVTIGRYFERTAKTEATRELSRILEKWAPKARTRWGGGFRLQDVEELEPEDHVIIREGEPIPVDGTIVYGRGAVDESLMTGEPFPVAREPGEEVLGGSVVVEGSLEIKVAPAVASQMDNLARVLWNVQSSSSGARSVADRVARVFVPVVLVLAASVTGVSLLFGAQLGTALLAGLATLIVSCPCTFGLAIPLTTAVGVSTALRDGIIVTSADAFEKVHLIDIVAIDKTGILSTGDMSVVDVLGLPEVAANAAAVERLSPHPIAKAIARLDAPHTASDLEIHPGKGATATVDSKRIAVGSKSLFATLGWDVPGPLASQAAAVTPGDGVVSFVGWDGRVHGAIVTRDRARPHWERVVDQLRRHCRIVLLTGAEHPTGYKERVDAVFSGIPPEGKAAVIRRLRTEGTVVMIGDGSNDAPALAAADLGIAFGAPSALAAEAADIIIPGERLERIFTAFGLIDTIRRRVRQNLGWALLYNVVAIPLAVTGLLNPLFAALAMASSSLLVVWNSSRSIQTAEFADSDDGYDALLMKQE